MDRMDRAPGGRSAEGADELVDQHVAVLEELVAETLRRVPSAVVAEDLRGPGRAALVAESRSWQPDDGDFADCARTRIRGALVEALQAIDWSARGRRPRTAVRPALLAGARAAVAALPGDRREVIEGYFLDARSLPDLSDDLALDLPEVVALRDEALHSLRRTLAPVLESAGQSSSGSSGTGSPRTRNLR